MRCDCYISVDSSLHIEEVINMIACSLIVSYFCVTIVLLSFTLHLYWCARDNSVFMLRLEILCNALHRPSLC